MRGSGELSQLCLAYEDLYSKPRGAEWVCGCVGGGGPLPLTGMAAFGQEVNKHVGNGFEKTIHISYRGFRRADYSSSMNQSKNVRAQLQQNRKHKVVEEVLGKWWRKC